MKKRDWLLLIFVLLIIALTIISPFLPGPSSLNKITISFYNFFQLLNLPLLLAAPLGIIWAIRRNQKKYKQEIQKSLLIPNLLWCIPLTIFLSLFFLCRPLTNMSRNTAINNSTKLITSLEKYRAEIGSYPQKIEELIPKYLHKIPKPNVMGIPAYSYQIHDNSYKISFAQNLLLGFNYEIVVYSPTEEYSSDTEYLALKETGKLHWKYYVFD